MEVGNGTGRLGECAVNNELTIYWYITPGSLVKVYTLIITSYIPRTDKEGGIVLNMPYMISSPSQITNFSCYQMEVSAYFHLWVKLLQTINGKGNIVGTEEGMKN